MTIEKVGRRYYIRGDTFSIRDQLRAAGCHWDPEARAWWTGQREVADQLAASQQQQQSEQPARTPRDGDASLVAGRAEYKGRTYYVAGRLVRGYSRWGDTVAPVETRDGSKVLLYFRDGSRQFWAAVAEVRVAKMYNRPQTIRALREYAEQARQARAQGYEDGIPAGRRYECGECGEWVTRDDGSACWETGMLH